MAQLIVFKLGFVDVVIITAYQSIAFDTKWSDILMLNFQVSSMSLPPSYPDMNADGSDLNSVRSQVKGPKDEVIIKNVIDSEN